MPFDARLHALRGQPGPQQVAARLRALLDGSPVVASHADCGRVQDPYTLRCAPQVLGRGGRRPGLRRRGDRARARARSPTTRSSSPTTARSSPAATSTASRCRCRSTTSRSRCRAGLVLRAPHVRAALPRLRRAAAVPHPAARPLERPDDRPVRGRRAGQRVPGARAPGRRRIDPDQRRPGGLQLDGRAGRRSRRARSSSTARRSIAIELVCACQGLEFHRPLRSTPALEDALGARAGVRSARGGGPAAVGEIAALATRDPHGDVLRVSELRCRGWLQEAALRMLENNLHPDVAEDPERLVVYGGIGKAARDHGGARRDQARADAAGRRRDAARPVGQAGRRRRDARRRAARADRQLEPRPRLGDVGALPRARRGRA